MTLNLTKPEAGSTGWAAGVNQNFTDIENAVNGAGVVTGIIAFTPTGTFTTNSTYSGHYWEIGDYLHVFVKVAFSGAPNAASLIVVLPSGYEVNTTALGSPSAGEAVFGQVTLRDVSIGKSFEGVVYFFSATSVLPTITLTSETYATAAALTQAAPVTIAAGDNTRMWFSFPFVRV